MRGGARSGAGRPITNPTKSVSIRLNTRQRIELKLRGGAPAIKEWLAQIRGKNGIHILFSEDEVADYHRYEAVRSAGKFNMFELCARIATKLTEPQYLFVMQNFDGLRKQAKGEIQHGR